MRRVIFPLLLFFFFLSTFFLYFLPKSNVLFSQSSSLCSISTSVGQAAGEPVEVTVIIGSNNVRPFGFPQEGRLIIKHDNLGIDVPPVPIALGDTTGVASFTPQYGGVYEITLESAIDGAEFSEGTVLCGPVSASVEGDESPEGVPTSAPESDLAPSYEIEPVGSPEGTPPGIVNGVTPEVRITFNNLDPDDTYFVCLRSDTNCDRDELIDVTKENDTFVQITVCGDGSDALKTPKDDEEGCDREKDYFHEGQFYRASLVRNDGDRSILVTAQFYVHYFYPQIILNEGKLKVNSDLDITSFQRNVVLEPSTAIDYPEDQPGYLLLPTGGGAPLHVYVNTRIKAGGGDRNNFQIVVEKDLGRYKEEKCIFASDNDVGGAESTNYVTFSAVGSFDQDDASPNISMLTPGNYILKVNEQINDGSTWRRSDDCQGGFTYYHIPFTVAPDKDGVNNIYILTQEIEADPNGVESEKIQDEFEPRQLPCATWVDAEGKETTDPSKFADCVAFETALGPLSTRPGEFISDIFRWVIAIAGFGGFALLIYAGYQIIYSRGDQERIQNAKENIKAVVIGFVFLVLSMAILQVIGVDILRLDTIDGSGVVEQGE